jgi:hypothetical protein
VCLYERQVPPGIELGGAAAILLGISLSIRAIKKREAEGAKMASAA